MVKVTGEVSPLWPTVADWLWFLISWRQILGVTNNGMVARELPLGPAGLPCIYMVFAPYLTSSSVRNSYYTHITAMPLQLHSFIPTFRCRLSSYPNNCKRALRWSCSSSKKIIDLMTTARLQHSLNLIARCCHIDDFPPLDPYPRLSPALLVLYY